MKRVILAALVATLTLFAAEDKKPEKASDALRIQVLEIQLSVERASSAVSAAKIAVTEKEKDLNTAVQKANDEVKAALKAANCDGCQLNEFQDESGKKQLGVIRPPKETAKK